MPKEIATKVVDESELRKLRAAMSNLVRLRPIAEQLEDKGASWGADGGGGLDMKFSVKGDLVGIHAFGKRRVVGLKIIADQDQFLSARNAAFKSDARLEHIVKEKRADLVMLTPDELLAWMRYYAQIEKQGLYDSLGQDSMDFSGLERMSTERAAGIAEEMQMVLGSNREYLRKAGVSRMVRDGDLDISFLTREGDTAWATIHHVRRGHMKGEILVKETFPDGVWCPGMVVRRPGESERETYQRAERIRQYYAKYFAQAEIPVVSAGQLAMWEKLGFRSNFIGHNGHSETISPEDVIRFGFLGQDNIHPGGWVRADRNKKLPGFGEAFGGVIVFPEVDPEGYRKYGELTLMVMNPKALAKGKRELVPLKVGGFMVFDDDTPLEEIKEAVKRAAVDINKRTGLVTNVAAITPWVMAEWKKSGVSMVGENASFDRPDEFDFRNAFQYGMAFINEKPSMVEYFQYRDKAEIGGNKNGLVITDKLGNRIYIGFDCGANFNFDAADSDFTLKPDIVNGFLTDFKTGRLPMVPDLWDIRILVMSANQNNEVRYSEDGVVASFLRSEIWTRMLKDDPGALNGVLSEEIIASIIKFGEVDSRKWRGVDAQDRILDHVWAWMMFSHGHWDHIGEGQRVNVKTNFLVHNETGAMMEYNDVKRNRTDRKYGSVPDLTYALKAGVYTKPHEYPRIDRHIFQFNREESIEVVPGVLKITPRPLDHSFLSIAADCEITAEGGTCNFVSLADFRIDGKDGHTMSTAQKLSRKRIDVATIEATKFGADPAMAGWTMEMVLAKMGEVIKRNPRRPIIILSAANDSAMTYGIRRLVDENRRNMALMPATAAFTRKMRAAELNAQPGGFGFDWVIREELGQNKMTIFDREEGSPDPYIRAMTEIAKTSGDLGVLTPGRLSNEPGNWVVVARRFDDPWKWASKIYWREKPIVLFADIADYDSKARDASTRMWGYWNQPEVGAEIISSVNHNGRKHALKPSGHVFPNDFLEMVRTVNAKTWIINHSNEPKLAADAIKRKFGRKYEVVFRMSRYDPTDPLGQKDPNNRGFFYQLT